MKEITTPAQLEKVFTEPVAILFKHSTTCPVSARAYNELQQYAGEHNSTAYAPIYLVKVIESRPISNSIAEKTSVKHESPQVFILSKGKVVWQDSHFLITKKNLEENMNKVKK